jgi:hypothetical protein
VGHVISPRCGSAVGVGMRRPMAAVALPTLPKATISSPPRRLIAAAMRRLRRVGRGGWRGGASRDGAKNCATTARSAQSGASSGMAR